VRAGGRGVAAAGRGVRHVAGAPGRAARSARSGYRQSMNKAVRPQGASTASASGTSSWGAAAPKTAPAAAPAATATAKAEQQALKQKIVADRAARGASVPATTKGTEVAAKGGTEAAAKGTGTAVAEGTEGAAKKLPEWMTKPTNVAIGGAAIGVPAYLAMSGGGGGAAAAPSSYGY
jgi:hypothetical protein